MNDITNTGQVSAVVDLQRDLARRVDLFKTALPEHVSVDKFVRTIVVAAQSNPDLLKADRRTLFLASMKAALDGLMPDGREAALVIFNNRKRGDDGQWYSVGEVQYMPMVYGLRKKIQQSGQVKDIQVGIVYAAEVERGMFHYEVGAVPPLQHRPDFNLTEKETADSQIIAAYSIATLADDTKSYEVMRRFEINKVRQTSKTGAEGKTDRNGKAIPPKGPWVDWFSEMAKKTVLRRHSKTLPMSSDVILEVTGDDGNDTAARSVLGMLSQSEGSKPALIESGGDNASGDEQVEHDAETGEIIEQQSNGDQGQGQSQDRGEAAAHPVEVMMRLFADASTGQDVRKANEKWVAFNSAGDLTQEENGIVEQAFEGACQRLDINMATFEPNAKANPKADKGETAEADAKDEPADNAAEAEVEEEAKGNAAEPFLKAITEASTIIDVNSRLSAAMEADLSEDGLKAVKAHAQQRIEELRR